MKLNLLAAFLVVSLQNFAQNSLKIGQQLPDLEINKILYYSAKKVKLSDLKGKLIILDFWSMSCSSCISGMPKMDSLQKYFGNKIAVLPVYPASATGIFDEEFVNFRDSFWRANPYLSKTSLPSVIDAGFAKNFPARVSYQVWIDGNRLVRAITNEQYVNKKEIQKMLDGIFPQWESEIKEDSYQKPVSNYLGRAEFSGLQNENYSFFTPYLKGIDRHADIDTANSKILISYKNTNILSFYRQYLAANGLTNANILLETKDSTRYFIKGYANEWFRDNSYCYELRLKRKVDKNTLADYIRQDANKYFDLNTRLENRNVNCLILKKVKNVVQISIKEKPLKTSMRDFFIGLRNEQISIWQKGKRGLPVLDETNSKSTTEINYPGSLNFANIPAVRKVLQSQGYDLVEETRMLKTFVISEIN